MASEFLDAYRWNISVCLKNDFQDNWDERRFGKEIKPETQEIWQKIKQLIKKILTLIGLYDPLTPHLAPVVPYEQQYQSIYQKFEDDESRQVLIQILSFRALGHRKVKLAINNSHYWEAVDNAETLAKNCDSIGLGWQGRRAYKMDLSSIGYQIELFYLPFAIVYVFVLHQYECTLADQVVKADTGDVVIDAGGCYGDTALYFAHEVSDSGSIYSFEFLPENLKVFEQNMSLNPELATRINLVKKPLWSESGETLFIEGNGPGTRVVPNTDQQDAIRVDTTTIDELVKSEKLDRVNFIKMDIEGAELASLHGAEDTIRRFHPKLAISVYHKANDLWEIPEYIESLGLGYRFALRHFTIHAEETILFAY